VDDDPPRAGEYGGGREGAGLDLLEVMDRVGDGCGQVGKPDDRDV
jgi:hypothetical protein